MAESLAKTDQALGMTSGNFGTGTFITEIMEPENANVTWRVYYPGGELRVQTSTVDSVSYLVQDHLNSTSLTLNTGGSITGEMVYSAWGETRYSFGATPTDRLYTGQYEAEAGLYFYNARWYDNQLGRFTQADTIIPNPTETQSWDRYVYVKNNPLRYTDPSGNYYCEGETICKHNIYHTFTQHEYIEYRINSDYGITLKGKWDTQNLNNLLGSLDNLESSIGRIKQFTNGTTYSFTKNSTNYGGITSGGNISFHGWEGRIPYQNFYHEIAHAINNQSGGFFTDQLSAKIVKNNDGNYLMGGSAREYDRNSSGFINYQINDPNGYIADAEQHPGSLSCASASTWCAAGNTASEEWGDLIANYVAGNFDNDNGMIRKNWIIDVFAKYWLTQR